KKSAQIREILISESAWEEMTCLFASSLVFLDEVARWIESHKDLRSYIQTIDGLKIFECHKWTSYFVWHL
ncbi:hypothetical protein ACN54_20260, partial [Escherichia coli]